MAGVTHSQILLAAMLAGAAPRVPATAASFDCGRAASPGEQFVCRDPALTDLDGRLGRSFAERKAALTPAGAELLQSSERGWLRFIWTVCPVGPSANASGRVAAGKCLEEQYQERLKQLADVGRKIGPFTFSRIDLYAAKPSGDGFGSHPGWFTRHVAFPQIDQPRSAQATAWNARHARTVPADGGCDERGGDLDVDYEIGYVTAALTSVQLIEDIYCHGAAHGWASVSAQNTIMSPEPRELTEADVFAADRSWVDPFRQMFWRALLKAGWNPPVGQESIARDEIMDAVVKPERWLFTDEGLRIAFNAYEGGCYACTPDPVVLPWSELRPMLSPSAVVP